MREHEYLQCLHFNSLRLPSGAVINMFSSSCAVSATKEYIFEQSSRINSDSPAY